MVTRVVGASSRRPSHVSLLSDRLKFRQLVFEMEDLHLHANIRDD